MRFSRIIPIIAGALVAVPALGFLASRRPANGLLPPRQLADPDSRFIKIDGLQFHYKLAGEGRPAIVLLHGFAANTYAWREVFGPLSGLGTVVAYDRPSSGLTERPLHGHPRMKGGRGWTGINPYSPEAQPKQLVELLDSLNIEKAILIGNSAGGSVAMNTALAFPGRVQALVLVDAAIYKGGGAPEWIKPVFGLPLADRLGPLSGQFLVLMGQRMLGLTWHDASRITPDVLKGYRKTVQVQNWDKGLWEMTKASRDLNLGNRVAEVGVPTLVITGDDDRIVPTRDSIRLAGELPNAELLVIPDCGHTPQEECPQAFLAATTAFVRRFA